MGEITAAVLQELSSGIKQVIQEEYVEGHTYLQEVEFILGRAKDLQKKVSQAGTMGNGTYRKTRDVVEAAAREASQQFQINDIKSKLKQRFIDIRKTVADHSSSEDDDFRAQLGEGFQDFTDEVIQMFEKYYKHYIEVYNANTSIYQNIMANTTEWEANDIMMQGYTIINKIAESIRGTSILYEVQLGIGSAGAQKTGFLTLDQIMKYTEVSYYNGAMTLKLKSSALRAAADRGEISLFSWDDAYRQRYLEYTRKVIAVEKTDLRSWASNIGANSSTANGDIYINRGNVAESFRTAATSIYNRYLESSLGTTLDQIVAMDDHSIHYMLHTTLQNTGSYWTGPDFEADLQQLFKGLAGDTSGVQDMAAQMSRNGQTVGVQEKVNNATFTNLNSLITQLTQISRLLMNINNLDQSGVNSALQGDIGDLDGPVETALIELVSQFLG